MALAFGIVLSAWSYIEDTPSESEGEIRLSVLGLHNLLFK